MGEHSIDPSVEIHKDTVQNMEYSLEHLRDQILYITRQQDFQRVNPTVLSTMQSITHIGNNHKQTLYERVIFKNSEQSRLEFWSELQMHCLMKTTNIALSYYACPIQLRMVQNELSTTTFLIHRKERRLSVRSVKKPMGKFCGGLLCRLPFYYQLDFGK